MKTDASLPDNCVVINGTIVELTEDDIMALVDAANESQDLGTDFEALYKKLKPFHVDLSDLYNARHPE